MPESKLLSPGTPDQQQAVTSRILEAFGNHGDEWRTVGGIARDSGLAHQVVQDYIRTYPHLFETSPISPGGMTLYSLRVDPRTGELLDQQEEEDAEASQ
jgi:hypothetical protein